MTTDEVRRDIETKLAYTIAHARLFEKESGKQSPAALYARQEANGLSLALRSFDGYEDQDFDDAWALTVLALRPMNNSSWISSNANTSNDEVVNFVYTTTGDAEIARTTEALLVLAEQADDTDARLSMVVDRLERIAAASAGVANILGDGSV